MAIASLTIVRVNRFRDIYHELRGVNIRPQLVNKNGPRLDQDSNGFVLLFRRKVYIGAMLLYLHGLERAV